ncbi:hypothetical protein Tco_0796478 [Tanacetum coccineum]
MRNRHVEVYGYDFWVNQCTSGFHEVNEPGGVLVAREDDRGVTEGREDVREVFQQRGSGAKRKLSRCGRNQMGNEPILALPEGADDFVVYYDARSKDLEACLEKRRRLSNRWLSMKKDVASCGSKYLAYSRVEIEYQGSSGLLLQPELPKTSRVDFRVLMPQVVKSRDEIFSRWGYCDNHDLSSDQLEWVLWYASWLSDQLEWVCGMLHGLVINWSSSVIETSRNRVNGPYQLVHAKFEISSWRGSRVDGRLYLLSGAIDGSEANRIIRDSKLEFENSRFT